MTDDATDPDEESADPASSVGDAPASGSTPDAVATDDVTDDEGRSIDEESSIDGTDAVDEDRSIEGTQAAPTRDRDRTRDRADDPAVLREELERLRDELASLEDDIDRRTVRRESLEGDLRTYVRRRVRRSHARGWGPYLVLLYGTAMTIGAFYFLEGGWAVLAMFVVWTSTLGVYLLMVLFGAAFSLLEVPGRLRDRVTEWRS